MNNKIMAIIYSEKSNFLLLKMNPKWLKKEGWFVVTGSLDGDCFEDAVKREVQEETNLEIALIKPTNYSFEYEWPEKSEKMNYEKVFLVKVKEAPVKLSGEHLEYKWVDEKDFLSLISWEEDIDKLKGIIKQAK